MDSDPSYLSYMSFIVKYLTAASVFGLLLGKFGSDALFEDNNMSRTVLFIFALALAFTAELFLLTTSVILIGSFSVYRHHTQKEPCHDAPHQENHQ